jgi:hypothetical protein
MESIEGAVKEILSRLPYMEEHLSMNSEKSPKVIGVNESDCWYKPNIPVDWILYPP